VKRECLFQQIMHAAALPDILAPVLSAVSAAPPPDGGLWTEVHLVLLMIF